MARKTPQAARAAYLTDKLLSGHMLTDDERGELRMLTAAATAEAEMPAAVRAHERALAKAASAQAEIDRLQGLIDAPNRSQARKGVGQ